MADNGTKAASRDAVIDTILELSTNVGLTEALADDVLDASNIVQWAASHVHADDAENIEHDVSEATADLGDHIRQLSQAGYDIPVIVLGLWFHLQQLELFLRDTPEDEREDAEMTPFSEYLPVDAKMPATPLRPEEEVEAFIQDLGTHVGLTEALLDDALDAGHLVTWAATRSHDAMGPGGEAEFEQVVEGLAEFVATQEDAGRDFAVIVWAIWMHVQGLERTLREEQPEPPSSDRKGS